MSNFEIHLGTSQPVDGKVFVGIKVENDVPKVFFPYGYRYANNEKEFRKDVLNLISNLTYFGQKKEHLLSSSDKKNHSFPIHAYIGVFVYYLNFGYYAERETVYNIGDSGKINWKKTIETVRPQISKGHPVYLEYVVERKRQYDNEIITQIHKYCVYESYKKIGRLLGFPKPQKPELKFDKNLFQAVLQTKIASCFNERNLMLFRNMLDIILNISKETNVNGSFFGTYEFDYVWQSLVDIVFGVDNKEDFYPRYHYSKIVDGKKVLFHSQPLFPDTVMISEQDRKKYYILDAKFYQYDVTGSPSDLPKGDSINKQFSYAEFVKNKYNLDGNDVYNAFILPYKSSTNSNDYMPSHSITADADWKKDAKNFERIECILLDIKSIMYRHPRHSTNDIDELAKAIENFD